MPIDEAMNVQEQLRTSGPCDPRAHRVAIGEVSKDIADAIGCAANDPRQVAGGESTVAPEN